jgi:hypothetical protein
MSLRDAYTVDGLSEEEQYQLALIQSQAQEDAAQAAVASVLTSYPPGPVTEQDASSVTPQMPGWSENPND